MFFPGQLIRIWDMDVSKDVIKPETAVILNHGEHGIIMRESKRFDTFKNSEGKEHTLSHIKEGEVFKVHTLSGEMLHVHQANMIDVWKHKNYNDNNYFGDTYYCNVDMVYVRCLYDDELIRI